MALCPLYGLITKGGGRIDKSPRWALDWLLEVLPVATPGRIRPIGRAVDVRIFSGVCATGGGEPAVDQTTASLQFRARERRNRCSSKVSRIRMKLMG